MIPCCGLDGDYGILNKSLLGKEFGSIKDMTLIVNECRNPGVCAPDKKPVLLDGPENAQVEMLPGGRRGSEPGVIAYVHQDIGSLTDTFLGKTGKDSFVTDEQAKRDMLMNQGTW
jgi:hypothetical protein